jgi:hypothetical protein
VTGAGDDPLAGGPAVGTVVGGVVAAVLLSVVPPGGLLEPDPVTGVGLAPGAEPPPELGTLPELGLLPVPGALLPEASAAC